MTRPRSIVRRCLWLCLVALLVAGNAVASDSGPSVMYTVVLAAPARHLAEVQITLPAGPSDRELQLPVWNALYQIRDFAQYVNWVRAKDRAGKSLNVRELDKSRWQVQGAAAGAIVEYQIYLDSPGPFGVQLNEHHAFLNLAQLLMYPVDRRNATMHLRFAQVPAGWQIATVLQNSDDGYTATGYDRLVDSPVEIGSFHESGFDEAGAHFRVVIDADTADYDMQKIVGALHRIVASTISWMNDRPFDSYTFFYHFPHGPAGGGMEHAYCTAIEINADAIKPNLRELTDVTAHEFFHLWNVKRIRPRSLEPIDYTKENYTRALWFSEGVTSTVGPLMEVRSGTIDDKQYLSSLGDEITELQRRPAHLTQSVEESSLDAWLEGNSYYRRPERSISYYNKGELVGVMLDLTVREATHGRASLREVMQWLNENYARKGRFFDDSAGIREAAEAVSHADLSSFFNKYVAGTDEIPWNDFFRTVGLRTEPVSTTVPDPGFLASRNFDGPMSVAAVMPGSDAERAGLQVGDTVVELQNKPVSQEARQDLARLNPGDTISVKIRTRRGGERELRWKVGGRQEISYELKDLDQVTAEQRARRAAWLKGEAQTDPLSAPGAAAP